MEAARTAAMRGHQVVLLEKAPRLGGQLNLILKTPRRDHFEEVILFFERQLERLGVDARLNTEATPDLILAESPDSIIVATGSTAYTPEIPGAEGRHVVNTWQVLDGSVEIGDRVVIVDTQGLPEASTVADYLVSPRQVRRDRHRSPVRGPGDNPASLAAPLRKPAPQGRQDDTLHRSL